MIAIAIVALYLLGLGVSSLWEIDEAIYAEIAREMVVRHDYVAPFFNYAGRFDKPPLVYWVTVGAYRLFGVTEFAVRVQSTLFGLLTIAVVWWLGRRLFRDAAGRHGAVVLATTLGFFLVSRMGITDAALTFGLTLAIAALWQGWQAQEGPWFLLSGAGLGLAILAKGPVAVVLFGAVAVLYLWRDFLRLLRNPWAWVGLALALLIPLPWHLAMTARFGEAFWSDYFGYHMFSRFTSGLESHGFPWWYYLPVLFATFLPWSLYLPASLRPPLLQHREERSGFRLLAVWSGVILVFFSVARTKLPAYILPAFPPLALLVGNYTATRSERESHDRGRWAGLPVALGLVAVGLLGLAAWYWAGPQVPPEYVRAYLWLAFFPAAYGSAGLLLLLWTGLGRNRAGLAFWAVAAATAVTLALYALVVAPALEVDKPVKPLATRARLAPPGTVVGSYLGDAGAVFYARRKIEYIGSVDQLASLLHGTRPAWLMAYENQLGAAGLSRELKTGRARILARSGKALLVEYNP